MIVLSKMSFQVVFPSIGKTKFVKNSGKY